MANGTGRGASKYSSLRCDFLQSEASTVKSLLLTDILTTLTFLTLCSSIKTPMQSYVMLPAYHFRPPDKDAKHAAALLEVGVLSQEQRNAVLANEHGAPFQIIARLDGDCTVRTEICIRLQCSGNVYFSLAQDCLQNALFAACFTGLLETLVYWLT